MPGMLQLLPKRVLAFVRSMLPEIAKPFFLLTAALRGQSTKAYRPSTLRARIWPPGKPHAKKAAWLVVFPECRDHSEEAIPRFWRSNRETRPRFILRPKEVPSVVATTTAISPMAYKLIPTANA